MPGTPDVPPRQREDGKAQRELHLGCGSVRRPGAVNLDRRRESASDVVADASSLPFADGSFQALSAHQLIEHLGYTGACFALAEAYRVLAPGGTLALETPDAEGAFRAFLDAPDREGRAKALGWIFGEETDGLQHRVLFPRDMLEELTREAGFARRREEAPKSWPSEPGLRWICEKEPSPLHDVLAALKARVRSFGWIRPDHQPEVVEFENQFVRNVLRHAWGEAPGPRVLDNLVMSASMTAVWLGEAARRGLGDEVEARRGAGAALALDRLDFNARLHACFLRLRDEPPDAPDGYEAVFRRGTEAAASVLADPGGAERILEETGLVEADGGKRTHWFGKVRCIEIADALRDRGLRLLARGAPEEAERLLVGSANLRVEPLYALWNLAVLRSARGDLAGACAWYEKSRAHARLPVRERVAREEAVCMLHLGRFEEALDILGEDAAGGEAAPLRAIAFEGLGMTETARGILDDHEMKAAPPLPPVRTRPVPVGEGVNLEAGPP